jgi:hypothetical protein
MGKNFEKLGEESSICPYPPPPIYLCVSEDVESDDEISNARQEPAVFPGFVLD